MGGRCTGVTHNPREFPVVFSLRRWVERASLHQSFLVAVGSKFSDLRLERYLTLSLLVLMRYVDHVRVLQCGG